MASSRNSTDLPAGVAHSRRSAMLMLTGLLAVTAPLPYTAVAVIPLAWAGAESVRSIQARTTARAPARGIVSSVFGLVLVCVLSVMALLPYAVYDTAKGLQDCTLGANTAIAVADCNSRFHSGLESIFGRVFSSGTRAGG